ncbi:MAG: PIG-L family deacetylase [Chloroflexi bacterium AL-W]|nr:PIG-L family deacetylase [Chloroflexi bacterium AL-W]
MTNNENTTETPRRVMGVFAHPDDPEFFAGGTLARWAAEGAEVILVLVTSGDKGSEDPEMTHARLAEIREAEEQAAAMALGAKEVVFLRQPDGEVMHTLELRRELTRLIRLKRPDTVITCDPTAFWYSANYINHPDHRAVGDVTMAAVFPTARDRLNFLELERDEGLIPHKVKWLYLAGPAEATHFVDISLHVETKINALREHKSQIKDMDIMAQNIRERSVDTRSPVDAPRHIEGFRVFTLA